MSIRHNIRWHVASSLVGKAIEPIFSILVARLLSPADYGVFAMTIAIKTFFDVFKDLGFKGAVIIEQREDRTPILFTVQIIIAIFAITLILTSMGAISRYLNLPILLEILPWTCLLLLVGAVEDPLANRYMRENKYKPLFYRQVIPGFVGGVISLWLAYLGYGVFSLVWGGIIGRTTSMLFLVIYSRWIPTIFLSWVQFRELFRLGKHITLQQFSGYLVLQADSLIAGKLLGASDAGAYKMSNILAYLLPNAVLGQVLQVVFTESAQKQHDQNHISRRYNQVVKWSFLFSLTYFAFLYALSPIFIPLILSDKWSTIIPFVQLMGVSVISSYLVNHNNDFSKIIGFNHIYSYFSIVRSVVTIIAVFIGSMISLKVLVAVWVGIGVLSNFINFEIFKRNQKIVSIGKNVNVMFLVVGVLYMSIIANWFAS